MYDTNGTTFSPWGCELLSSHLVGLPLPPNALGRASLSAQIRSRLRGVVYAQYLASDLSGSFPDSSEVLRIDMR